MRSLAVSSALVGLALFLGAATPAAPVEAAASERLIVAAAINGQPVRLGVDTGSAAPLVLWQSTAARLGLEVTLPAPTSPSAASVPGLGRTGPTQVRIEGQVYPNQTLAVFRIPRSFPRPDTDGILGWPALRGVPLRFEIADHALLLGTAEPANHADWHRFRLLAAEQVLAFAMPTASSAEATVLVDTGAPMGVALAPARWRNWRAEHLHLPATYLEYFTLGAGRTIREETWADTLSLNGLVLHGVPVIEADPASCALGGPNFAAVLGLAALRRVDLAVDPVSQHVWVRPRADASAPYRHNRLGAVFAPGSSLSDRLLAHVAAGSPAEDAGIRPGDRLLQVGAIDVAKGPIPPGFDPGEVFEQPAGTGVALTLERGPMVFTVTVTLRNLLGPDTGGFATDPGGHALDRPDGPPR